MFSEIDFADYPGSGLIAHMQGILARFVGEICDEFAGRGPGCLALRASRGFGDVSNIAFLGRNREDIAVGAQNSADAGGRYRGETDAVRFNLLKMRTDFEQ